MSTMLITEDNLAGFLKSFDDREIIVPTIEKGNLLFGDIKSANLATKFVGRPIVSPKEFMFPRREKMFVFNASKAAVQIQSHLSTERRIIWGIRPCDLKAINTLDTIFLSEYIDSYYGARRENTILMGLNCNEPCQNGFCLSCESGPFATGGFDLSFTDLGAYYLVESGSNSGEDIINKSSDFFKPATFADKEKAKLLERASLKGFKNNIEPKVIREKLSKGLENGLWAQESTPCMLCGGCNFVCPTCHCFNIEDTAYGEQESIRLRFWDSCQFKGLTQMAAENTRMTQAERLRQRIFHKYVYTPNKYNGVPGCTGCGRCIEICPAEVNIAHILERIEKIW